MLLTISNVYKSYRNRYGKTERMVLSGVNLQVEKGEKIAITGPSGSGKSTLLNLTGGLDLPDEGEIIFDNRSLAGLDQIELAGFRNRMIGFIFQAHHLLPQCSLLENILIPTLPFKESKNGSLARAEDLMKKTGIWELRNQKPGELSGGECQRGAVVRSLINHPQLILADEPTGALDEKNADAVMDLITGFNRTEKVTVIVVTHSREVSSKMDKQYHLTNGKLE